jgi:glycosyltransferase involved in cell wall biosynthesis
MKKKLSIISETFPFGGGEQFFLLEIQELAKHFDRIEIFPLIKVEQPRRPLPSNVSVNFALTDKSQKIKINHLLGALGLICKIMWQEFWQSSKKRTILKRCKFLIRSIVKNKLASETFVKEIDINYDNYFYSFWMNDGALMLAILKDTKKIDEFCFRVNGYDIFDERHPGNYNPFQLFNFKNVKRVFVLSSPALNYLKAKKVYSHKLELAHYGFQDNGLSNFIKSDTCSIVSCGGLIPLKQVSKIVAAIKLLPFQTVWRHFGDGPLMEFIQKECDELPPHIQAHLMGNRPNTEIIEFYQKHSIDLFIHTSETEGLGMSIIEAQGFGIPAVVLGVGGVVDIVNEQTGVVLLPNATNQEIANAIRTIFESNKFGLKERENIQKLTLEKFHATKNYSKLAQLIIQK